MRKWERGVSLLQGLDYASVFVFALTGALAASRAQLDVVGFLFLACLTAVGGGTLRDVILNRDVVFWVLDPAVILSACLAAVLVFFTAHLLESRLRALEWCDAFALAAALFVCGCLTFALRAGSLHFGWCLPVYKSRARRD